MSLHRRPRNLPPQSRAVARAVPRRADASAPMLRAGFALFAAALAALLFAARPAPAQEAGVPAGFADMVERKLPAVVGILSTSAASPEGQAMPQLPPGFREFFGEPSPGAPVPPPGPRRAQGSGFIISPDGYVVTNNHVIEGAEEIDVVLDDERQLSAELVGTDPATDIALLKIDGVSDLPVAEWGDSTDLRIGEWVVAIGNPFGLGGTVTAGIVSARSRNIQAGPYDDFIQTDAAINRGNSGGPLFDAGGQVVGVNTAIFSPTGGSVGIGFAVPSAVAQDVVEELRETGQVSRGFLGVQIQTVTEEIASAMGLDEATGALVADVTPGSPAAEAGVRPGDIVTAIGDREVADPRDLSFAVAEIDTGTEATLVVMRNGEQQEIPVTIGEMPTTAVAPEDGAAPEGDETPRLGVTLAPLDGAVRSQLDLPDAVTGVAISSVANDSPAARAGLRRGDVIVQVGGEEVASAEDVQSAVSAAVEDEQDTVLLRLYRGESYAFVAVPLETDEG